jgi:biopolymer transport protein ExbD
MRLTTGYEDRKARIEMIPLMDVIFLLLSAFIYATFSLTVYRGLRVDLPRGTGAPEDRKTVVVSIRADDTLWLDGREMDVADIVRETSRRVSESKAAVLVSGDRSAGLGVAVELLSGLRKADVEAVSFQVREEK